MAPPDLALRPGTTADLPAVAEVFLASRRAAVPAMPPLVHPDPEVRAFVLGWDLAVHEVWVAEGEGGIVGFVRLTQDWLDDLYVAPAAVRQGIGTALLELAKVLRPGGFALWVFVSNVPARGFYARQGLLEEETTDGTGNEERAPDVRVRWEGSSGRDPDLGAQGGAAL